MDDFIAPYRFAHGCGTITARDGTGNKEGVAAGGQVVGYADTVEVYSVAEGNWRYGTVPIESAETTFPIVKVSVSVSNLPLDLIHAASVPIEDSFALFGGLDYADLRPLDSILRYISDSDSWVEMEAKLVTPRGWATVIPLKRSIFPPC